MLTAVFQYRGTSVKRREFLQSSILTAGGLLAGDASGNSLQSGNNSRGAITDVPGIKVGHFTDQRRPTGCTVIIAEEGATGGVDVRGAAPGTRETDLLNPLNTVELVNAVVLSGGSAFGLETATGVMRYLEEKHIGFNVGVAVVPIVPAAILFDLGVGDAKIRPDAESGYKACQAATTNGPAEGNFGAGAGATVGKLFGMSRAMKSGIGTAAIKIDGITVGAIVAVNAVGDIFDFTTGTLIAGARTQDGKSLLNTRQAIMRGELPQGLKSGTATTIGVVATDARLTKAQASKIAQMSHDGLARAINPVHTPSDGDTMFALATGKAGKQGNITLMGMLAAEMTAAAIVNAIRSAKSIAGFPSASDLIRN
jgi:L-aminopeptidase/D-esterase-like protein